MTPERRLAIHGAMVRFADGNRDAFREVFDSLWPVLLAFAASRLPIREDAEDVAQRALLKVFSQIADMDRSRDGVTWVVTIAAYEVMTVRRTSTRRREQGSDELAAVADVRPSVDEQIFREETRAMVRAAIGDLPQRDQAVLAMILNDGPVTKGETARKRRYRALRRLRALWEGRL